MITRKILIILSVAIIFSGCAEFFLKPYGYVASDAKNVRVGIVSLPESAPTISQGYNPRPEIDSEATSSAGQEGIDIYAKTGTPVITSASGVVIDSYYEPFYGNQIVMGHGNDEDGTSITSRYFHLNERLVNKGEMIVRGQQIGTLGSSGILASYPHLHFEIRVGPRAESSNPHIYWFDGVGVVTCFDKSKNYPDIPFRTTYPVVCR